MIESGVSAAACERAERNLILATAGHVDHGKSALVKALTGTDPDRLPEEKARGITIDLGFAHLRIPASSAAGEGVPVLNLGIVDVPGHEDFIKNMVAGVGAVDLALLVVAADDGWMPQTEEHLQILSYLGVTRAVVAVTKIDRVSASEAEAKVAQVHQRLAGTVFAGSPLVRTSVRTGAGLDELRRALADTAYGAPPRGDIGKPRMWIDRAFSLRGVGTIVTGTLIGGCLRVGEPVCLSPQGTAARIRSLQSHKHSREVARPGTRTAVNLVGVEARGADGSTAPGVARGMLLTEPMHGAATDVLNVWLERSSRSTVTTRLAQGTAVRVYVGTAAVGARVVFSGREELAAGEADVAQLRLAVPLALLVGDRLVLRDATNRHTLAGGIVLDPDAQTRRLRQESEGRYLRSVAAALTADDTPGEMALRLVSARLERDRFAAAADLGRRLPCAEADVDAAVHHLLTTGRAVRVGTAVALRTDWQRTQAEAGAAVEAHHAAHPAQLGMPLVQLRAVVRKLIAGRAAFEPLVGELTRDGFEVTGAAIRRRGFAPRLPDELASAAAHVRAVLAARRLDPPTRRDLAPDAARADALLFLIKTGQVIALTPEVMLATEHFERAAEAVRRHLAHHGKATVSELRQVVGASRRVVVPLLEKLDRDGVTTRVGDARQLRQPVTVAL